jgi:hypothetical protein
MGGISPSTILSFDETGAIEVLRAGSGSLDGIIEKTK